MKCFYCSSDEHEHVKAGFAKGKQRYKCKKCRSFFTVEEKSTSVPKHIKRIALNLYLEGLGFNSIGRALEVSHVSVQKWIKKYGKQAEELKSEQQIEVVEIDEMHSYIGQKKTTSGFGLLLIDTEKNSSISYWAKGIKHVVKHYGTKSKVKKLEK